MGVVVCLQAWHNWTDIKEQMAIQKGMKIEDTIPQT